MMRKYIDFCQTCLLLLLVLLGVYSCKLKTVDPDGSYVGYDYYPLEAGRYIIYDEYDTIYDPASGSVAIDTFYQVKEKIEYSYKEGSEEKFVIYRFLKQRTDTDWPLQPDSVWTAVNTSNQLVRTENNTEYIKLVFPVKEGKTWNGNALNQWSSTTSPDKYYKMSQVDQPYTIGSVTLPETLIMTISNQADPIVSKDIRYDVYARGIGFVKKDYTVYYYKQDSPGAQIIDYGSHKVMFMTSYGKE